MHVRVVAPSEKPILQETFQVRMEWIRWYSPEEQLTRKLSTTMSKTMLCVLNVVFHTSAHDNFLDIRAEATGPAILVIEFEACSKKVGVVHKDNFPDSSTDTRWKVVQAQDRSGQEPQ
jgi:hypothetical protein